MPYRFVPLLPTGIPNHNYTLKKRYYQPGISEVPLFDHNICLITRRGKSLIEWAERNNGILNVKEAKGSLVAAGLIKPGKRVGSIAYGTIAHMDCWEKVDKGVYKLLH